MTRGKKQFEHRVVKSVAMHASDWEYLRLKALKMSKKAGRNISQTELVRLAVYECYPELKETNKKEEEE